MVLQPLAPPPERTLPDTRPTRVAEFARRARFVLFLLLAITGCRDTFAGFGAGSRARLSTDQLFGALAIDTPAWRATPSSTMRVVRLQATRSCRPGCFRIQPRGPGPPVRCGCSRRRGAFADGRYTLASHSGVQAPRNPAEARHVTTLSKLSNNEYRWDTTVDFAIGSARPAEIAAVLARLIAAAERSSEREVRANLLATAPRTSTALGPLFSLDSFIRRCWRMARPPSRW